MAHLRRLATVPPHSSAPPLIYLPRLVVAAGDIINRNNKLALLYTNTHLPFSYHCPPVYSPWPLRPVHNGSIHSALYSTLKPTATPQEITREGDVYFLLEA